MVRWLPWFRSIEASGGASLIQYPSVLPTASWACNLLSFQGWQHRTPLTVSFIYFEFFKIRKHPVSVQGFSYLGSAPPYNIISDQFRVNWSDHGSNAHPFTVSSWNQGRGSCTHETQGAWDHLSALAFQSEKPKSLVWESWAEEWSLKYWKSRWALEVHLLVKRELRLVDTQNCV